MFSIRKVEEAADIEKLVLGGQGVREVGQFALADIFIPLKPFVPRLDCELLVPPGSVSHTVLPYATRASRRTGTTLTVTCLRTSSGRFYLYQTMHRHFH